MKHGDHLWILVVIALVAGPAQAKKPASDVAETESARDPLAAADAFLKLAQQNRLGDSQAAQASVLLRDENPLVRGAAEWALSMKVGHENNGQVLAWPKADPPAWFQQWLALTPQSRLEADWARQAIAAGIHRDSQGLLASVDALIVRARRMAADAPRDGLGPEGVARVQAALGKMLAIRADMAQAVQAAPGDLVVCSKQWIEARRAMREIVLAGPAESLREIVLVKQYAPHTIRNITRTFSWQHKPGGDICILSGLEPGAAIRPVLKGRLGPGHVRDLDVGWDADRVVFGYARQTRWPPAKNTCSGEIEGASAFELRKQHEPIHLFEVRLDGSGLRQRTDDSYWNDFEPTYLADGEVVFCSDRCARSAECGPFHYDIANSNLYVLGPDGAIRHLTDNKDVDRHPHALDNGLVAYTHWEYQERHFMEIHSLWTVRPDGAMSDALFKQHMSAPYGLRDTRSIPGSAKLVSIATGHHTFAQGPVVMVDPRPGVNAVEGLRIVTPGVKPQEGPMAGKPVAEGGVADRGGLYQTPWALSEKRFLVSYAYARPNCTASVGADSNGFAIYLIDVYGNRELVCRDPLLSCAYPMPRVKRPRPPRVPHVAASAPQEAVCYLPDVYEGMPGVARGTVRHIRIAQHVPWPLEAGRGMMPYMSGSAYANQFGYWDWAPVRVIGTVSVEDDGSAHFTVPAGVALYFQALDERQMEIRRMRTMVSLAPGEVRGCRGCHESQAKTPSVAWRAAAAMRRPPRTPAPPPWGADKMLGYTWLVQPVLDRHCVRCHGSEKPDGGVDLSAREMPDGFAQSFRTMFGLGPEETGTGASRRSVPLAFSSKGSKPVPASSGTKGKPGRPLVAVADRFGNAAVTRPKQFGSHKSPLVQVLLCDELHRKEVQLSPDEWLSLVTWVDANAPYFDKFVNKRPADGGKPRRDVAFVSD